MILITVNILFTSEALPPVVAEALVDGPRPPDVDAYISHL